MSKAGLLGRAMVVLIAAFTLSQAAQTGSGPPWKAGGPAATLIELIDEPIFLDFQSRIRTVDGPSRGPDLALTFEIVDNPSGGTVLWRQGPQTIGLRDGFFRVTLGDGGQPLTADLFAGSRWLKLDCNGCVGRRIFPIRTIGRAVVIRGAEKPEAPGIAAAKPLLRNKRVHDQRAYPTGVVPGGKIARAYEESRSESLTTASPEPGLEVAAGSLAEGMWTEIGPSTVTGGQTTGSPRGNVSGRVNTLEVHPTDPNTAYAGGAQGGLWKTINGGANWMPLTDDLASLATGAVALAPSNPNIIYLGTGEANFSLDSYWGAGIFISTDAGNTFNPTADIDPNRSPINSAAVAEIAVHPGDPNIAIVAVGTFLEGNSLLSGGIYRTTDGGGFWTRTLGPSLTGPVVGSDIKFDESDPNIVYAALGWIGGSTSNGVYQSLDGGVTFSMLAGGFPTTNVGRINIDIAPSDPLTLFASVHNLATNGLLGIWRSQDAGGTWVKRNATGASCGAQCWYDMEVLIRPTDPDFIYFGGVNLYRSNNGGNNFASIMNSAGTGGGIHVDHHALAWAPSDPNTIWVGNDGGVWKSSSPFFLNPDWENLNTNLGLLQFQSVAVPPSDPNIAYGGTQDNGTNKYTGSTVWAHVEDGDGGQTAVDFINPQTVYHTFFNVSIRRSDNGGSSWFTIQSGLNTGDRSAFYVPLEMDLTDPAVLYLGTYRLYRTANKGNLWSTISPDLTIDPNDISNIGNISAIGVSKSDSDVIYVGTSNGQIQVTSNLGGVWINKVSPPLPDRFVTSIAVDPGDANTAYATYSGFDDPASGFGHVFKTNDLGSAWTDITGNVPDIPVNQIIIDPAAPQMLYLATDLSPYVSTNGGESWLKYSSGYPNVAAFEMAVQQPNLLFAATHGRGMFQALGCTDAGTTDADLDGVADFCDNCDGQSNPAQIDADMDGFGPPCDCADADPSRNPGVAEICNGIDDDCDGISDQGSAPPDPVDDNLIMDLSGSLSWNGAGLAEHYNVYRGLIQPGVGFNYNQSCLAAEEPGLFYTDTNPVPPAGEAYYYLLASENCLAESNLGSGTGGTIPNSSPCP